MYIVYFFQIIYFTRWTDSNISNGINGRSEVKPRLNQSHQSCLQDKKHIPKAFCRVFGLIFLAQFTVQA